MLQYIYFLHDLTCHAIKIGTSTDPRARIAALQVASPSEQKLLRFVPVVDGYGVEEFLHRRFQHLHVRGEWFRAEPELLSFALQGEVPTLVPPEDGRSITPVSLPAEDPLSLPQLSELTGVSGRTIRYYIAEGVLPGPSAIGRGAYYGKGHLDRIRFVSERQKQGESLSQIKQKLSESFPAVVVTGPKSPPIKELAFQIADDVVVRISARLSPWRQRHLLRAISRMEQELQLVETDELNGKEENEG